MTASACSHGPRWRPYLLHGQAHNDDAVARRQAARRGVAQQRGEEREGLVSARMRHKGHQPLQPASQPTKEQPIRMTSSAPADDSSGVGQHMQGQFALA